MQLHRMNEKANSSYKPRLPGYSIAWDILVVVLTGIFLFCIATPHYGWFYPAFGFTVGFAIFIGSFRTRNPHWVYWGLQGFVWALGIGFSCAARDWFSGTWQETSGMWLFFPLVLSMLLALCRNPLIAILKKLLLRPSPKNEHDRSFLFYVDQSPNFKDNPGTKN